MRFRSRNSLDTSPQMDASFSIIALALGGRFAQPIARSAHRLYYIHGYFLAQAANEHLDRVRVAVEVLLVEVLDQLRARHDAAVVVHHVGEQAVLVRGELDLLAVAGDARRLGVEPQ